MPDDKSPYDETWDIGGNWVSEQPEYDGSNDDFGSDAVEGYLEKELCSYCAGEGVIICSRCCGTGYLDPIGARDSNFYESCPDCSGGGPTKCPHCEGAGLCI